MQVFIIGNIEQNVFQLATASNPKAYLSNIQLGSPHEILVLSKICVKNKNAATLIESLGRREMQAYEGRGGWIINVPAGLVAQLASDRYLRSLADRAGVELVERNQTPAPQNVTDLKRLTDTAKRKELTFQDVLDRVEQAYNEGVSIEKII